jgi:hypothetical protein
MRIKNFILIMSTMSLVGVVIAMCWMFIYAILDSSVDDKLVFDIIAPAFQTIVGGFIGLITGIQVGKQMGDSDATE